MDTRKEAIKYISVLVWALLLPLSSCNQQNGISAVVGYDVSEKIHLKETKEFKGLFESSKIQIYEITDTSLFKNIPADFSFYGDTSKLAYCTPSNVVNKYPDGNNFFYKVIEVSDGEYSAVFVDGENKRLIHHEVSYLVK